MRFIGNIVLQNDVHFIFLSDSDTFKYMQCHQYMQNDYSAQILVVFWINRAKNNVCPLIIKYQKILLATHKFVFHLKCLDLSHHLLLS